MSETYLLLEGAKGHLEQWHRLPPGLRKLTFESRRSSNSLALIYVTREGLATMSGTHFLEQGAILPGISPKPQELLSAMSWSYSVPKYFLTTCCLWVCRET